MAGFARHTRRVTASACRLASQVLPQEALEDGPLLQLLDSPVLSHHDEDAWEIKFPVTEVVIGKNQFAPISGLFYPDGTVRRLRSIEAVAGRVVPGLAAKPDEQGMPIGRQRAGWLAEYARFMTRNEVTESTWRERNTALAALIVHGVFNPDAAEVLTALENARTAYKEGRREVAYRAVKTLLIRAAEVLTDREAR